MTKAKTYNKDALTKALPLIAKLPLFSAQVYKAVLDGLYAEPYFSDIECSDLAKELTGNLETGVTAFQVMGAMKKLVEVGLCSWDNADVNGVERNFIQAEAHNLEYKEAAYTAVNARLAELNAKAPRKPRVTPQVSALPGMSPLGLVEPAMEHLRNALQILDVARAAGDLLYESDAAEIKSRIEQALIALAAGNVGK